MDSESAPSENGDATEYDPTIDLQKDRRRNDLRLKGRFEHIFDKYAKDFSSIGDEIDLETGEVVVNNGHLVRMQNERDVGAKASSRFVKAFEKELVEEERVGHTGDSADSDEDELSSERNNAAYAVSRRRTSSTSEDGNDSDGNAADLDDSDDAGEGQEAWNSAPSDANSGAVQPSVSSLTTNIFSHVPGLQNSLTALVPQDAQSGQVYTVNPEAIHALGQSIAHQIADFLTRATQPSLQPTSRDPWSIPPLPGDRMRTPRYDRGNYQRQLTPSPYPSSPGFQSPAGGLSLWAPIEDQNRGPHRKRKRNEDVPDYGPIDPSLMESVEDGMTEEPVIQDDPSASAFLQQANATFRALALGIVNTEDNVAPNKRTDRRQRDNRGFYTAEGDYTDSDTGRPSDYANQRGPNKRFSKQEDNLIRKLRDIDGLSWQEMLSHLPGRTLTSLQGRYSRYLRHLPTPQDPIIKREIVEIMDDEDDVDSEAALFMSNLNSPRRSPAHRSLPNHQTHSPSGHGQAPLLRQALGNSFAGRPANNYFSSSALRAHPSHGYSHPYTRYSVAGPAQTQAQASSFFSQPIPPSPPNNYDLHSRKARRVDETEKPVKPYRAVYNGFDSTSGSGSFGVLRSKDRAPMVPEPFQQQVMGPVTERTGSFGVLRMGKAAKPSKSRKKRTAGPASEPRSGQNVLHNRIQEPLMTSTPQQMNRTQIDGLPPMGMVAVTPTRSKKHAAGVRRETPVYKDTTPQRSHDSARRSRESTIEITEDSDDELFMTPGPGTPPPAGPNRSAIASPYGTSASPQLPRPLYDASPKTNNPTAYPMPTSYVPWMPEQVPRHDFEDQENRHVAAGNSSPATSRGRWNPHSSQGPKTGHDMYMPTTPNRATPKGPGLGVQSRPIPVSEGDSEDELA